VKKKMKLYKVAYQVNGYDKWFVGELISEDNIFYYFKTNPDGLDFRIKKENIIEMREIFGGAK
jgi:hypothetical protein